MHDAPILQQAARSQAHNTLIENAPHGPRESQESALLAQRRPSLYSLYISRSVKGSPKAATIRFAEPESFRIPVALALRFNSLTPRSDTSKTRCRQKHDHQRVSKDFWPPRLGQLSFGSMLQ